MYKVKIDLKTIAIHPLFRRIRAVQSEPNVSKPSLLCKRKVCKIHEQIKNNKYIKIICYMYIFLNRINFTLTVLHILHISFTVYCHNFPLTHYAFILFNSVERYVEM